MENKVFNVIIAGVGGQGVITLLSVIAESARLQGYDVRSSELHGLSQRGGSVLTHLRFGKKIYSPMVQRGGANLIIGLEMLEALRQAIFANSETKFVINKHFLKFEGALSEEKIMENFNKLAEKNLHIVPASKDCKEKLQNEVVSTLYILGYLVYNNLIPLKKEFVLRAIENTIPKKYLELNKKAFNLSYDN